MMLKRPELSRSKLIYSASDQRDARKLQVSRNLLLYSKAGEERRSMDTPVNDVAFESGI